MTIIDMDKMGEALNTKADIDLNNTGVFSTSEGGVVNLTSSTPANASGKEVTSADFFQSNLLNYTTNRILEIPQDIKLELNNGTLTLKAGSKVYVPNGSGNFDVITTTKDYAADTSSYSGMYVLSFINGNPHAVTIITNPVSGDTAPTSPVALQGWYDTTNNLVKRYNNGWQEQIHSFPLAICTSDGTKITSIDQVFNGFGYIGSTVFALPGVKVQAPNGKNKDGTYNSSVYTISTVFTSTIDSNWRTFDIILTRDYLNKWPNVISGSVGTRYNSENNYYEVYSVGQSKWVSLPRQLAIAKVKADTTSPYKITSFEPYTVDSVVNSNLSNLSAAGEEKLKSNIQLVNELPANPEPGVLYCIPEA